MEEGGVATEQDLLLLQVRIPDLNTEKCLQFPRDERVWEVKQQLLAAMPKELEDSFNYGLFQPPANGRAGKFLDEERRLSEYPFQDSSGHLELKYKRRVYKVLNLDEKQLKSINSRANLKKFLDNVLSNNVEKVNKMCNKGLDPNFHCQESGETPLSLIAGIRNRPSRMVMALVNGGAILDFRTKDGSTAMHRAVATNNIEAVRTMLELGASPNYRDNKSLTPLYHSVINQTDPSITETLLHDHGIIGAQDMQGWQEVHQVCRSGLVSHLEHLLFYGADMNARNASGNTPLHVCAVNNQDSCARMLLFRGANKEGLNYAGQTAYQVAVIAGNLELAEVIQFHKTEDIVPFKEAPKFNPRRRQSGAPLSRTMSDCGSFQYDNLRRVESPLTGSYILKPSSPSLSDRSLPPFSSGSSISETSTGSGGSNSTSQDEELLDSASILAASIAVNDHNSDILSVSSGVGTSSNSGSGGSAATPTGKEVLLVPGMTVVSLENYSSSDPSHLKVSQGDVIEVTGSTDNGLLEGVLRGQTGYFPVKCVEEARLRNSSPSKALKQIIVSPESQRVPGRRDTRDLTNKHFGTADTRGTKGIEVAIGQPRSCVLHKGKKGFGFVLRGAKAASPLMEMIPSDRCPSLQYMDDVDPAGVADMAGVSKGDFLLAINSEDVTKASHEQVVNLIRKSGDLVALTLVTVTVDKVMKTTSTLPNPRHFSTLPRKPGMGVPWSPLQHPPPPPKRDPNTTLSVGRARAKSMIANMGAIDALDSAIKDQDSSHLTDSVIKPMNTLNTQSVKEPDTSKTKNFAKELELIFQRDGGLTAGSVPKDKISLELLKTTCDITKSNSANSSPALGGHKKKIYNSVSQMKRSKKGLSEHANLHKDFNSTPDLQSTTTIITETKGKQEENIGSLPDLEEVKTDQRKSHSQEDIHLIHLNMNNQRENMDWKLEVKNDHPGYYTLPNKKLNREKNNKDDGYRTLTRIRPIQNHPSSIISTIPSPSSELGPAPDHPPPPPPLSHLMTMDTSGKSATSEYAKVELDSSSSALSSGPVSSFKPANNARFYESPKDVADIGFQSTQQQGTKKQDKGQDQVKKRSPTRTHSLPPRPRPLVLQRVVEPEQKETYSVNGVNYTTYTTFRSPITPDDCDESVSNRHFTDQTEGNAETPTTPTNEVGCYLGKSNSSSQGDTPHIPEPDYDVSDVENQSCSGSESSWKDTATLRRNQRKEGFDRKKKKTVSFIMNEELASIIHSSGTMTKRDSILKDSSKEKDIVDFDGQRVQWGKSSKKSPSKISPPQPETPKTPSEPTFNSFFPPASNDTKVTSDGIVTKPVTVHPDWQGGSIIGPLTDPNSLKGPSPKLVSSSKIRIEVCSNGGESATQTNLALIQKSQSFSGDSETMPIISSIPPNTNSGSPSTAISQSALQKARMQLKSSRSFPELLEDVENSSSGVSSDQDQECITMQENMKNMDFVTKLTVTDKQCSATEQELFTAAKQKENYECDSNSSGTGSTNSDDITEKTWIPKQNHTHGQMYNSRKENIKQIIKNKDPVGTQALKTDHMSTPLSKRNQVDHKSFNSAMLNSPGPVKILSKMAAHQNEPVQIEWSSSFGAEENHYQNFTVMMQEHARKGPSKQLGEHVNVKRPFQSSENLMSKSFSEGSYSIMNGSVDSLLTSSVMQDHNTNIDVTQYKGKSVVSADSSGSRSIEDSLALIKHHVQGLNEAQYYGGVPPPPPSDPQTPLPAVCPAPCHSEGTVKPPVLAPPPGFSDSASSDSAHNSDAESTCSSLQSDPGAGNFQRFGLTRVSKPHSLPVHHLTDPSYKKTVSGRKVPNVRKSANGLLEPEFLPQFKSGVVQKEFRAKMVLDWTVSDVCDWLDSLFLPEHKAAFLQNNINGYRLAALDGYDWDKLGVTRQGHRLNIQKSIKRYMPRQ